MHDCHNNIAHAAQFHSDFWAFIVNIFLIGLSGSFGHCIAMCGPIAMAQSNMRLLQIKTGILNEKARLMAALAIPYYLGKTIGYTILLVLLWTVKDVISSESVRALITASILILVGLSFMLSVLHKSIWSGRFAYYDLPNITKPLRRVFSFILNKMHPFGIKGIFMGILLGLLPCGFVTGVVLMIVASTNTIVEAVLAVMIFGVSTIPALFLVSYFGMHILKNTQNYALKLHNLLIFLNGFVLFYYGLKLLL